MKIHSSVQKLLVGLTHTQAGDLISPLSFLESRLEKISFCKLLISRDEKLITQHFMRRSFSMKMMKAPVN
jgi:hypothetical protein